MRAMGAPQKVIDRQRVRWEALNPAPDPIEVFPENIDAFRVLVATADQWETPGPFGGRLAVPLSDVRAAMQLLDLHITETLFLRVKTMLSGAREVKFKKLEADARKAAAAQKTR